MILHKLDRLIREQQHDLVLVKARVHELSSELEKQVINARIHVFKQEFREAIQIIRKVESNLDPNENILKFIVRVSKLYVSG